MGMRSYSKSWSASESAVALPCRDTAGTVDHIDGAASYAGESDILNGIFDHIRTFVFQSSLCVSHRG